MKVTSRVEKLLLDMAESIPWPHSSPATKHGQPQNPKQISSSLEINVFSSVYNRVSKKTLSQTRTFRLSLSSVYLRSEETIK